MDQTGDNQEAAFSPFPPSAEHHCARSPVRRVATGWGLTASRRYVTLIAAICACAPCLGCRSFAAILAHLGSGRGAKVQAQFRLGDGPLLVFIDDVHDRADWPEARAFLFDELSQELLRHEAAKKIVPRESIDALRQADPDFNKKSCRLLGEQVGAEQVLWVEVRDFLAEEQITGIDPAAYFTVTVKVLNAMEKESRNRVRVWPVHPEGQTVTIGINSAEIQRLKTKDMIAKQLAVLLAVDIAKLFYEHREGDS